MATEIVMPRLGWTMEVGSVAEWLKKDGDLVKPGDIIFTVESDKAVNEIESFDGGILRIPPDSPSPGTLVPVGKLLAYLVQPGEAAPFETGAVPAAGLVSALLLKPATAFSDEATVMQDKSQNGKQTPAISPRARRVAGELSVDWKTLVGSGRTGRIVERDVHAAALQLRSAATVSMSVSPLARRVAEELNVNLDTLAASLPGKRIDKADVERAAAAGSEGASATASSESRRPISTIRRIIATRMSNSAHTAAPVTLTTEADATELVKVRKQLKKDAEATGRIIPSYNDLLAKLVAESLVEFPALNSRFEGDEIVHSEAVHIGIAVDTDRGLLVPVLRDVQAKRLHQIARESVMLIERARSGSITTGEISGGTFSISNLGMYEIDAFTPIINLPECAILGVGRIIAKQVVVDAESETVAVRQMMFLSLTFDHRLVDGAPAARFLQRIKQSVEHPFSWLV